MEVPLAVLDPANPKGAWAREHLASDIVGWLTTVAPDGTPQPPVVAFFWDGAEIVVYSRPSTPKVRNIAANPRVAFNLQSDPYGDHALSLEGIATPDPSLPRRTMSQPTWRSTGSRWRTGAWTPLPPPASSHSRSAPAQRGSGRSDRGEVA